MLFLKKQLLFALGNLYRHKINEISRNMKIKPPGPYFTLRGHEGEVSALHFTTEMELYPNQAVLISGSDIGEIFIWNMKSYRTMHRLKGHDETFLMCLFYHESSLLSQGRDGFINRWNYVKEWTIVEKISLNSTCVGFCQSVIFPMNDSAHLFYLNEDEHLLQIGKLAVDHRIEELKFDIKLGMCFCIKLFQINGKVFVLAGFEEGSIALFDCESKDILCRIDLQQDQEPVLCLDFDENTCMGMSGSVNEFLNVWKVTESMEIVKVKIIDIKERGVNVIKIRQDGQIVITAGIDGIIRIFSWKTLKPLAVLKFHEGPIQCLSCCPVSIKESVGVRKSIFASGSKDHNICLWDIY